MKVFYRKFQINYYKDIRNLKINLTDLGRYKVEDLGTIVTLYTLIRELIQISIQVFKK